MKVHRLAHTPPCGNPSNGKRQTLCGRYLHADRYATAPEKVTCQICVMATTSERTSRQGRLNMEGEE